MWSRDIAKSAEVAIGSVSQKDGLGRIGHHERLLLSLVHTAVYGNQGPFSGSGVTGPIDWDRLRDMAIRHGVLTPVARVVLSDETIEVPDEFRLILRRDAGASAVIVQAMCKELIGVVEDVKTNEVDYVAFKGPTLSVQAYGDFSFRKPGDLDLLVRRDDVGTVRDILEAHGYLARIDRSQQQKYLRGRGSIAFHRNGYAVDLHWTLQQLSYDSLPGAWVSDTDDLVKRSVNVVVAGHAIRTLSPEDHFEFLCLHGAKDNWSRLIMIADLAALVENVSDLDWSGIRWRQSETGPSRVMNVGVLVSRAVFGVDFPAPVLNDAEQDVTAGNMASEALDKLFRLEKKTRFLSYHSARSRYYRRRASRFAYVFMRARRRLSKLGRHD